MGMYGGAIGSFVMTKEKMNAMIEEAHHDSSIDRLVNCIYNYDGLLEVDEDEPRFVKIPQPNGDVEVLFIAGMRSFMIHECLDYIKEHAKFFVIYMNSEYMNDERVLLCGKEFIKSRLHILDEKVEDLEWSCDLEDGEYVYSPDAYMFGYVVPAKWEKIGEVK